MLEKLNSKIAELIGMHTGDGTLYRTNTGTVWELRGALNEKDYYYDNVIPLLSSIFNKEFKPKFRSGGKNGCFGVQICKREVTSFFIDYGFKPGRKTHTVRIPDYIKKSNKQVKLNFIKGLFDTDGCLRFDKNGTNRNCYPKIEFGSASEKLIEDLSLLLKELKFNNYTWKSRNISKLCIAGKIMLKKWIKEIKPKNPKHLNKYETFQKLGYVLPNAEVAQPGTAQT
jgi:intein/homing endonuclease